MNDARVREDKLRGFDHRCCTLWATSFHWSHVEEQPGLHSSLEPYKGV